MDFEGPEDKKTWNLSQNREEYKKQLQSTSKGLPNKLP